MNLNSFLSLFFLETVGSEIMCGPGSKYNTIFTASQSKLQDRDGIPDGKKVMTRETSAQAMPSIRQRLKIYDAVTESD